MADTFSFLHEISEITSTSDTDPVVITDGIDIFYYSERNPGDQAVDRSLFKYNVLTNTHAEFVNESNFTLGIGGDVELRGSVFIVFKGNIYAINVFHQGLDWDPGDPVARVWRISPTGTVTTVIANFPRSQAQIDGTFQQLEGRIYATEDFIVATVTEVGVVEPKEFKSQWSSSGTGWLDTTETFVETIEFDSGANVRKTYCKDFRTLGIYDRFPLSSANVIVIKFINGVWSKVLGPIVGTDDDGKLFEVAQDHFWNRDDFGQYTDDWSSNHQPVSTSGSILGLNMPYAVSQEADATTIVKLDTDNPFTTKETDSTMATDGFAIGSQVDVMIRLNDGNTLLFMKAFGSTFPSWSIWQRSANLTATPNAWQGGNGFDPPQIPLPCSIDADGTFIYIAAINTLDLPVLLKFNTDMSANPTVIFQPGLGNDVGVICGRESANNVWIAGAFGGTDVVEKSEDAGATFVVKDDGTFGTVEAFAIGPDSDDRVLIVTNDVDIEETIDNGVTWTNINAGVAFNVNAIARLAISPEEIIFGNDAGAVDNIDYSIDSGGTFEDLTTGVFPTENVKRIIVND